jgi:hypothetical protein
MDAGISIRIQTRTPCTGRHVGLSEFSSEIRYWYAVCGNHRSHDSMRPSTIVTSSSSKGIPLPFVFGSDVYASRRERPECSESHCTRVRQAQRAAEGVYAQSGVDGHPQAVIGRIAKGRSVSSRCYRHGKCCRGASDARCRCAERPPATEVAALEMPAPSSWLSAGSSRARCSTDAVSLAQYEPAETLAESAGSKLPPSRRGRGCSGRDRWFIVRRLVSRSPLSSPCRLRGGRHGCRQVVRQRLYTAGGALASLHVSRAGGGNAGDAPRS